MSSPSVILAHVTKGRGMYALYVEGALKTTWDFEVRGFDKPYMMSQAQRWCRPGDEIGEIEIPELYEKLELDVDGAPEGPKPKAKAKRAPKAKAETAVEGD